LYEYSCTNQGRIQHTGMNIYTLTLSAPNLILSVVTGFGSNILTK
jgi:hypothetical protein